MVEVESLRSMKVSSQWPAFRLRANKHCCLQEGRRFKLRKQDGTFLCNNTRCGKTKEDKKRATAMRVKTVKSSFEAGRVPIT
jgi:hypothetical protein